jgi:hypothetical protein
MTRLELIESVKMELGHPVIELFVTDEQINIMIGKAIRRCQSKVCPTFIASKVVSNGIIDVTDLDIEAVRYIYSKVEDGGNYLDMFGMGLNYAPMLETKSLMDAAIWANKQAELERLALPDFMYRNNKIYVDNFSGEVTIEFVKRTIDLSDLDSEWLGWVESYVTASAKVIEGRIRGKYRPQGGPFEIEADTLVSEGTSTMQDLESKLENSFGYHIILR